MNDFSSSESAHNRSLGLTRSKRTAKPKDVLLALAWVVGGALGAYWCWLQPDMAGREVSRVGNLVRYRPGFSFGVFSVILAGAAAVGLLMFVVSLFGEEREVCAACGGEVQRFERSFAFHPEWHSLLERRDTRALALALEYAPPGTPIAHTTLAGGRCSKCEDRVALHASSSRSRNGATHPMGPNAWETSTAETVLLEGPDVAALLRALRAT